MKPRPLPYFAFHAQFPAMVLDDAVADGKAQARALVARLGGEERVENALAQVLQDALAVVFDGQTKPAAGKGVISDR